MKYKLSLILFFVLLNEFVLADIVKKMSSNKSLEISSVVELNGNYYVLLNESYQEFDQKNSFLLKLNKDLSVIDTININTNDFKSYKKILVKDNVLLLFGITDSISSQFQHSKLSIIIIDTTGNIISNHKYHSSNPVFAGDIEYLNGNLITTQFETSFSLNKIISTIKIIDSNFIVVNSYIDSQLKNNYLINIDVYKDSLIVINGQILSGTFTGGHTILFNKNLIQLVDIKDTFRFDQFNFRTLSWINYNSIIVNNSFYTAGASFTNNPFDTTDTRHFERISLFKRNLNGKLIDFHIMHNISSLTDRPLTFEYLDDQLLLYGTKDFYSNFLAPRRAGNFFYAVLDTNLNLIKEHEFGDSNYQQLRGVLRDGNKYLFYGFEQDEVNNKKIPYIYKVDNIDTYTFINNFPTKNKSISIYPNPSTSEFNIRSSEKIKSITIFNTNSQLIMTDDFDDYDVKLNLNEKGLFFLRVQTEGGVYVEKVLVSIL